MAGLTPAAVICEVMNEDGSMARLPDLQVFAREHGLKIGTIAALIQHRSHNESLIDVLGSREIDTPQGRFHCTTYRDRSWGGLHLALTVGQWSADDEVLVRVHEPLSVMDLLDAGTGPHSWPLPAALAALQQAGRGAAVLLNAGGDAAGLLGRALPTQAAPAVPAPKQVDLRTYGVGAQILRHLGVHRMKLLGNPRMPSMTGYGWKSPASSRNAENWTPHASRQRRRRALDGEAASPVARVNDAICSSNRPAWQLAARRGRQ
jgi:3,4-dihydroxy 2-butanone 4-phosphate synthase/GTP cyclohydrolase II